MLHELLVDARLQALGICGVDEELGAVRLEEADVVLVDLEVGDGLPFVHGYAPACANTAAGEVDDELFLIAAEAGEDGLQSLEREGT